MNISYHAWKAYKECPRKYYLKFFRKTEPTRPDNNYFKLYGLLMEKFFEMFSNKWRFKTPYMPPDFIRKKLRVLYDNILEMNDVDWYGRFVKLGKEDIFEQALHDVQEIMNSENHNLFLNTKSEVAIEVKTKDGVTLSARIDFIHKNLDNSVLILDGKGANKVKKNVSDDQLMFYALLYYLHTSKIPERLAFFYYRFNLVAPVPYDINTLNEFRARVSKDVKDIINMESFKARPSTKACKFCPYNNSCPDKTKWQAKKKKSSIEKDAIGIVNLGF